MGAAYGARTGQLIESGYAVIPDLIGPSEVDSLCDQIQRQPGPTAGTRRLIDSPWCRTLAERVARDEQVRAVLPQDAVVASCTLFTKSSATNWLVPIHQDLSIPVAERVGSQQCTGWSEKEGELFVQPPTRVLEQLLAIRIHLDDCDDDNGALRVVPGSHKLGRLSPIEAQWERNRRGEAVVEVSRGGAMLMRPLLLHASSKVRIDALRRVLHFVFGPPTLPEGLRWRSGGRRGYYSQHQCTAGNAARAEAV